VDSELGVRIGARIRRAREAHKVSQQELAQALELSQAAISNVESGSRPLRVDELITISRVLGEDPDYFLVPMREQRGPVGVTLRAQVADLPLPEFADAINAFLDEVEDAPFPTTKITVKANTPEQAANQVLQTLGRTRPPIDVLAVARDLGIAVFSRPFPSALSALLLRHGKNAFVGVNSHQAPVRQHFSVAHELGHFVLHHRDHHFIDYGVPQAVEGELPGYSWQHERAANQFAAELLMPADVLREDARTTSLSRLARRYDVSQEAMGFRLANLGL
jgi:Zn-dependent peptidase ImmA (M78 family)/transcriptional regulator with XRE-family HTH domain